MAQLHFWGRNCAHCLLVVINLFIITHIQRTRYLMVQEQYNVKPEPLPCYNFLFKVNFYLGS